MAGWLVIRGVFVFAGVCGVWGSVSGVVEGPAATASVESSPDAVVVEGEEEYDYVLTFRKSSTDDETQIPPVLKETEPGEEESAMASDPEESSALANSAEESIGGVEGDGDSGVPEGGDEREEEKAEACVRLLQLAGQSSLKSGVRATVEFESEDPRDYELRLWRWCGDIPTFTEENARNFAVEFDSEDVFIVEAEVKDALTKAVVQKTKIRLDRPSDLNLALRGAEQTKADLADDYEVEGMGTYVLPPLLVYGVFVSAGVAMLQALFGVSS